MRTGASRAHHGLARPGVNAGMPSRRLGLSSRIDWTPWPIEPRISRVDSRVVAPHRRAVSAATRPPGRPIGVRVEDVDGGAIIAPAFPWNLVRESRVGLDVARLFLRFPELATQPRGSGDPVLVL